MLPKQPLPEGDHIQGMSNLGDNFVEVEKTLGEIGKLNLPRESNGRLPGSRK